MNKSECINAIQWAYGMNKTEANKYYKTATTERLNALVNGFKANAKQSLYND